MTNGFIEVVGVLTRLAGMTFNSIQDLETSGSWNHKQTSSYSCKRWPPLIRTRARHSSRIQGNSQKNTCKRPGLLFRIDRSFVRCARTIR